MIARVRFALPFVITIPIGEELNAIEFEENGYGIKIMPPYQANLSISEAQFISPNSMRETLEKLTPAPQPTVLANMKINGEAAYQANALEIVFQKEAFDRGKVLVQDRSNFDPSEEFIFKVANNFLSKLHSVTQGIDVRLLGEQNTLWRLEYLTDTAEDLPQDPDLFRANFGYSAHWSFTVLNKNIIEKVASLPRNYEMQTWESLILDAEALSPDVRASLILAYSALETLIAIALDFFVTTTPTPPELWEWVNKRGFFLKEPSVEERYTTLLKILTSKSLKDDPALWRAFDDLRKARNSIAHTGRPILNRRKISAQQAGQLIGGAKSIINWLEQLLPESMRRPINATQTGVNIIKPIV